MSKGGAKTIRRAKKSGNRRRLRLKRYADKLAPALLHGASADVSLPDFSQCGVLGALRATMNL